MEESKVLRREFQGNILLVLFLNALIKPLYLLGIDRGVQNRVPAGEYGLYFTLFQLSFIFQIVADFGLQAWLTRTCAQNPADAQKQYPYFLSLKAILSLLYLLITGTAAFFLGFWVQYPFLLTLLLGLQLSNSFLLFLRATISGLGFYRYDSYLSVSDRALCILIMGLFLYLPALQHQMSIMLFVGVQLFALLLSATVSILFLRRKSFSFRLGYDYSKLKILLREGFPYAVLVLLMSTGSRIDTLLIPLLSEQKYDGSALYAGSFRILEALNIIGYLFAGLLLPMFSKKIQDGDFTAKLANKSIRLLLALMIPLAFGLSVFSESIIPILYQNASLEMATTFSILVLAIIPMGGNYIYGTLLTATGSLWAMNRIFVLILGINIVLNLFLLPRFGIPGVALASLITHSLAFILQLRLCLKKQVVGSSASLILRIFLFSVLTGLSVISLKFFLPFRAPNLPLILLTGLLLSGIAMGITGMIHKSDWRHLPNETVT